MNRAARAPERVPARAPSEAPEARPARQPDAAELRTVSRVAEMVRAHSERLTRMVESRRKLVDAVREMLQAGRLDEPEEFRAAADGLLRRGAPR